MDRAFDILNSKSKYGKHYKQAITPARLPELRSIYEEVKAYYLSLDDPDHQLLHTSRRKTFIVGFICTFNAVLELASDLFASGCTYFQDFTGLH